MWISLYTWVSDVFISRSLEDKYFEVITDSDDDALLKEAQRVKDAALQGNKQTSVESRLEAIGTDAVRATEVFTYKPLFKKYPRVYCFLMYRLHRLIDSGEIIVVEEGIEYKTNYKIGDKIKLEL